MRVRRGLTLLELLASLVIIASVTTLVAAMWGQLVAWSRSHSALQEVITRARFEDAAARQWATRLAISVGERASREAVSRNIVALNDGELSIVTPEPLLYADAPLVLATYRVVADADRPSVRLVYVEAPLTHAGRPPLDAQGAERRTLTVIERADDLRWQRWVNTIDENDDRVLGWFDIDESTTLDAADLEPAAFDDDGAPRDGAGGAAAVGDAGDEDDEERDRVRPPRSVRLTGRVAGRGFEWVFSDEASR